MAERFIPDGLQATASVMQAAKQRWLRVEGMLFSDQVGCPSSAGGAGILPLHLV